MNEEIVKQLKARESELLVVLGETRKELGKVYRDLKALSDEPFKSIIAIGENVDWSRQDVEIAKEYGVTRERVRQVRIARGAAQPRLKQATPIARRVRDWIEANPDKHGQATRLDISEATGASVSTVSSVTGRMGFKIARNSSAAATWPDRVNWDLPNQMLAQIWDISCQYISNTRCKHNKGRGRWLKLSIALRENSEFIRLCEAEKENVRNFHKPKDTPCNSTSS